MNKTNKIKADSNSMAVDINGLKELLGVGKYTANKIGKDAGAVFYVGRRKLFILSKVQAYLDQAAEKEVY